MEQFHKSAFGMQVPTGTLFDMQFNLTIDGGKATLVTIESGTETTTELEGNLDTNALVLKSTEEKTEEDAEDYSLFDTDTMRLYLLDDGKLCFTSADSMDDSEETQEAADGEDSEDSMDWTVKYSLTNWRKNNINSLTL